MKISLLKSTRLFLILLAIQSVSAQASLLISPMRVALDERNRAAKVVLINTGDVTRTYRVEWVQKAALPQGGYKNLTDEEAKDFPIASNMFRLSPRQVTLAPNERQIVKIAARRPKNLKDGEYRSHLLFTALPRRGNDKNSKQGAGITLKLSLSYSIPVVLRQGAFDYQVGVEDLTLIHDTEKKQATVQVKMSRSGPSSTTGSIVAYWTPKGGSAEKQVAILNSVNFYPELNYRVYKLHWFDYSPGAGTLRLAYEGGEEMRGSLITEKTFNITRSNIVTKPKS